MANRSIDTQLAFLADLDFDSIAREFALIAKPTLEWNLIDRELAWAKSFQLVAEQWRQHIEAFAKALDFSEPFRALLDSLAAEEAKFEPVEAAGWLPHHTTPFDQIVVGEATQSVSASLSAFYSENWRKVKAQLLSKLDECDVDDEAKETFEEALNAHESSYFRYAPRVLFPEIERVVREEFFPGDLETRLASQPQLIKAVSALPGVEVTRKFVAGMRLYKKLARHLYVRVNSQDMLASVRADPVPNRHAALHGLAIYKSQQNSLNAIIMAEFAFLLITMFKRYSAANTEDNVAA